MLFRSDPYAKLPKVVDIASVRAMQKATLAVTIKKPLVRYITELASATRVSQMTELGVSPRGSIAVSHMAKASALMSGRDYVTEEDIRNVFVDVCSHRIILTQKVRASGSSAADVLNQILGSVKMPYSV